MMKKDEEKKEIKRTRQNKVKNTEPEICPLCGGGEYVIDENDKAVPCKCHRVKDYERRIREAGIPEKFLHKDLDSYAFSDKKRRDIINAAKTLVQGFNPRNEVNKGGFILRGCVGSGKTHVAIGILKGIIEKGYSGYYANVPDLLRRIRATYSKDADEDESDIIERMINCDLLVLDDLGAEATTGWVRDRLYIIINALYEKNKTLIVTTNCSLDELNKQIGERITSRICELCHELPEFPNEDFRRKQMR